MKGHPLRISEHLKKHKTITDQQARTLYSCTRLSSVIHRLRAKGYPIGCVIFESKNKFGDKVTFGKYYLTKVRK